MVSEILNELVREVQDFPLRLVAEVVQFLILAAIVWFFAIGFGKRRGIIVSSLQKRHDRVKDRLTEAKTLEGDLGRAKTETAEQVKSAKAEARRLKSEAALEAQRIEAESRSDADAEAERMLKRVDEALGAETEEMRATLREELVEVVAYASRKVLNENSSPAEQRDLIEKAVLAATGSVEPEGSGSSGKSKRSARPKPIARRIEAGAAQ